MSAMVEADGFRRISNLFGGDRLLRHRLSSALDAHELLLRGLPVVAVQHLVSNLRLLRNPALLETAIGMSLRTFQRRKEAHAKPLSQEQSARAWKFAAVLAKAIEVFGSQDEAERWLEQPAMGLDQRRPIDLLATPAGVALVEQFLTRLEYGVYA